MPAFDIDPSNKTGSSISFASGEQRRRKDKSGFNRPVGKRKTGSGASTKKSSTKYTNPSGKTPAQHKLSYWLSRIPKDDPNRTNRAYALQKRAKANTDKEGKVDMAKVLPRGDKAFKRSTKPSNKG